MSEISLLLLSHTPCNNWLLISTVLRHLNGFKGTFPENSLLGDPHSSRLLVSQSVLLLHLDLLVS